MPESPLPASRLLSQSARNEAARNETADQAMRDKIETLDTLSAILPALAGSDRAEQLARLLTDEDIDTLRHLAREGMGENSLRALTSDFPIWKAGAWRQPEAPCPGPHRRRSFSSSSPITCGIRTRRCLIPVTGCLKTLRGSLRRKDCSAARKIRRAYGPACTGDCAAAPCLLVDAASLAFPAGTLLGSGRALGHATCVPCGRPAAGAEKPQSHHGRLSRAAARDM